MQIDYALNIPSALGFFFLMIMIYLFAKEIFKSKAVGILSILFFIFNSSLDFLKIF
jgi:4-amino-4-deoxy-L-arabinose transferase-like glycosyltransferase